MSLRRVLFVDDEESILAGLRNLLRKQRGKWEMVFVLGGQAALAELAKAPFDVVVTDMRMPGMDGAELLTRVKRDYPAAARIVLSGHADRDAVMRAIPVTHQYLSKPCDAETLRVVIERACDLQRFLTNDLVRQAVGRLDKVPSVPRAYTEITTAMLDPNVALADVARIVERDPGMSAKVLQLVNSAFFGLAQPMASVQKAVTYLGLELLRALALASGVFAPVPVSVAGLSLDRLQARSFTAAALARKFLAGRKEADEAFTAAVVHDVGILVLATALGDEFREIIGRCRETKAALCVCEREVLGVTHAEVGAYLLGGWGLPVSIVETVAFHHTPGLLGEGPRPVLAAVHVADVLADAAYPPDGVTVEEPIDEEFLGRAGHRADLPRWRAVAEAELGRAPVGS